MDDFKQQELAKLFYNELLKIHQGKLDERGKIDGIYFLINLIFVEATREEKLQFSTAFARLSFVFQKHKVEKKVQFWIHSFRRERWNLSNYKGKTTPKDIYELGVKATAEGISSIFKQNISKEVRAIIADKNTFVYTPVAIKEFRKRARVVLLEDDEVKQEFIGKDEENPTEIIRIRYNIADQNENFNATVREIRSNFGFPITVNLIDVAIDKDGIYRPRAFVVDPDYLVDVSAISECFKEFGTEPLLYLLKKFMPFESTKYLMIGNIANFFLDELMTNPEATFKETFPKVFRLNPLAFVLFEESVMREIWQKSQKHFLNLKRYVVQEFKKFEIEPQDCFIEPSFFSERYGIQGRLDAFYIGEEKSAIIELKSGKAYMPNRYGISNNHFTQTLLYDLIVRSVYNDKVEPVNYIFYSGIDDRQLRYAPAIKAQQFEALQTRNQILALEKRLESAGSQKFTNVFHRLSPSRFPQIKGFLAADLAKFEKTYYGMSDLEREYFHAFCGFIAREHRLAKVGQEGVENLNGHAGLWRDSFVDKEMSFDLLSFLAIAENKVREEEPLLVFNRTEKTHPLANFRNGDIAILYPYQGEKTSVLNSQIFKCNVISINQKQVTVSLRQKQFNTNIFDESEHWNLEHDMMDSGFGAMYKGLYAFAKSPQVKRDLLLTINPPQKPEKQEVGIKEDLTEEQQNILEKAIAAKDYFLLWGPPGTGKTSKMLKHFAQHILENTKENLLLLAYTNRAVDEICEAIESIHPDLKNQYVRIGSKYSTSPKFRARLLSFKSDEITHRKQLKGIIDGHRVFVSTLSSFTSKQDLLKLKKFHRVVIDEASQILEPALVGLLPNFERYILIGDHKQLPAVVVQDEETSVVENKDLKAIGLHNLRNSFFERLYKRCVENKWDWAYAKLSHQGRMHADIMDFPNRYFYEGFLKTLPENIGHSVVQKQGTNYLLPADYESFGKMLSERRTLFFHTEIDELSQTKKTNLHEAEMIGKLVESYHEIYQKNGRELTAKCIGIITPYRAQIAQIQEVLQAKDFDCSFITIDTVERYQGGARDIILVSLCTNSLRQVDKLVSLSEEGVDRKLNVALTRAREHVVVVGNADLLGQNAIYGNLIREFAKS
ncbi:MAG: DNA replication ATP-dependent helicase Dna2 [Saprospiraceae bacterium]|jgi:DNA replication ATP-dependent helicase Dna2